MPRRRPRRSIKLAVQFTHKAFVDLTLQELYDLMCLRDLVFVVGQKVTAEPEVDGLDPQCIHVLGRDAQGQMVATARLFWQQSPVMVGRVAVLTELQRAGVGSELMHYVNGLLGDRPGAMHAQAHLEAWYTLMGWQRHGDVFVEAEIDHVHMTRRAVGQ